MKRNDLDIKADILKRARFGARKTHIVYGCNLNFRIVKNYLSFLIGNGLLVFESSLYHTTDKGEEFLSYYSSLRGI